MQLHTRQLAQETALFRITGGNSTFTIKSVKTGTRFTYKVEFSNPAKTKLVVKVMFGNDNVQDYKYMCHLEIQDGVPVMTQDLRTPYRPESKQYVAFEYVFYNLLVGKYMPFVEIWHSGRCCRCGRKLTVPESIESGIGPECSSKNFKFI